MHDTKQDAGRRENPRNLVGWQACTVNTEARQTVICANVPYSCMARHRREIVQHWVEI